MLRIDALLYNQEISLLLCILLSISSANSSSSLDSVMACEIRISLVDFVLCEYSFMFSSVSCLIS